MPFPSLNWHSARAGQVAAVAGFEKTKEGGKVNNLAIFTALERLFYGIKHESG